MRSYNANILICLVVCLVGYYYLVQAGKQELWDWDNFEVVDKEVSQAVVYHYPADYCFQYYCALIIKENSNWIGKYLDFFAQKIWYGCAQCDEKSIIFNPLNWYELNKKVDLIMN